jgi:hypothetical protein
MEETKNPVTTSTNAGTVASLGARRVTGDRPQGIDEVNIKNDLKMPRLSVLQLTSAIVAEGHGKMGDLAHSITKEVYGKELEIIPLFMFKSRAQFEQGKGLVLLSRDNKTVDFGAEQYEKYVGRPVAEVPHPKDPSAAAIDWAGKEAPTFSLVYNFLCILTGPRIKEFPLCLSFMRTGVPTAKDFLSTIAYSQEDAFARVYKLRTKIEDGDKGKYAVPIVDFVRRCSDEEYTFAQKKFQELYSQRSDISVDLEGAHVDV